MWSEVYAEAETEWVVEVMLFVYDADRVRQARDRFVADAIYRIELEGVSDGEIDAYFAAPVEAVADRGGDLWASVVREVVARFEVDERGEYAPLEVSTPFEEYGEDVAALLAAVLDGETRAHKPHGVDLIAV